MSAVMFAELSWPDAFVWGVAILVIGAVVMTFLGRRR